MKIKIVISTLAAITALTFSFEASAYLLQTTINSETVGYADSYSGNASLYNANENFITNATLSGVSVTGNISNDNFYYQHLNHGASAYSQSRFEVIGASGGVDIFFTFRVNGNFSLTQGQSTIQNRLETWSYVVGSPELSYEHVLFNGGYTDYGDRGGTSGWFLEGDIIRDGTWPIRSVPESYTSEGDFIYDSYAGRYNSEQRIGEFSMSTSIWIEGITSANYSISMIDAFYYTDTYNPSISARSTNSPYLLFDDGSQMMLTAKAFPTAVPEPETYALMLLGLGLVGIATKHKSSF